MEVAHIATKDFVVENVLGFLDTEQLFTCAEVNRLWQSVALSLLRKKLISVSVCCAPDTEGVPLASALGSAHMCVEIFCSKFSRYRNIARMAGMRPSLVFLSYHGDLNEDRKVVERLRELLPSDSVILYFKLELVGTIDEADDATHEGVFGEFLFCAETHQTPQPPLALDESDDQQTSHSLFAAGPSSACNSQQQKRKESDPRHLPGPAAAAATVAASSALLPAPWARPRLPSVGSDGGAVFRNVLPGVLMFQALHVTMAGLQGHAVTSHFTEEATGRTVMVTSAALLSTMPSSQLEAFMRSLSDSFGSTANTVAVAFPRNQDEALAELEVFERCFRGVPALANQATEFNVGGQFAPLGQLKLVLLLIKLLD
ncbi:uncharacterized protein LOC144094944 [Amblyomma americanum]